MASISVKDFHLYYGDFHALKGITAHFASGGLTALIGPSGCGKSTLLKSLNRMNDLADNVKTEGEIDVDGENILSPKCDVIDLRRRVGMVFQKPNPFAMSVFDNVAYGPRTHQKESKSALQARVEKALRDAALWDEVKDSLHKSAFALSGGQQQRLCLARCLAVMPEVILLDEPTSALDPISTARIEELLLSLKERYTMIMVTHNMQQAARVSDRTAFFWLGELVEMQDTHSFFSSPGEARTEAYITGRLG